MRTEPKINIEIEWFDGEGNNFQNESFITSKAACEWLETAYNGIFQDRKREERLEEVGGDIRFHDREDETRYTSKHS